MITVYFNDEQLVLDANMTLLQLLNQYGLPNKTFAAAVNRQFVARNLYATTVLRMHDVIEIVFPMQGG